MPSEKQIKDDVRKWSRLNLEVPNQHLNGMPACPFAKKTWAEKKVLIKIKQKNKWYKTELNSHLQKLNLNKHEILIFCDPYFSYTIDDFQGIIDSYNFWYNRKDIYFMGFHPRGTPTLEEHAFLVDPGPDESYDGELEYSMMLIQKFSQLQEASDKLHKAGYYDGWPKEYYNEVVKSRYKTYNKSKEISMKKKSAMGGMRTKKKSASGMKTKMRGGMKTKMRGGMETKMMGGMGTMMKPKMKGGNSTRRKTKKKSVKKKGKR